jgi:hypothetical protein
MGGVTFVVFLRHDGNPSVPGDVNIHGYGESDSETELLVVGCIKQCMVVVSLLLLKAESSSKLTNAVRSGEMEYPPFLMVVTTFVGRFLQKNIHPNDLSMKFNILDFLLLLRPIFIGSIDTKLLFIFFDEDFHMMGFCFSPPKIRSLENILHM